MYNECARPTFTSRPPATRDGILCNATRPVSTSSGQWPRAIRLGVVLATTVVFSAGITLPAFAQRADAATLRGTVLDSSGHVLRGAKVALESARTSITRYTMTDSTGDYAFPSLPPGPYRLSVELSGFNPWQRGEVNVSPVGSLKLDAMLTVAVPPARGAVRPERPIVRSDARAREGTDTVPRIQNLLDVVGQPALLFVGVILARWILRRLYRAAVLRQMHRQNQLAKDPVPTFPNGSEARIEFREARGPSSEGVIRASLARRAAGRQALGRWAAVAVAALAQYAALVLFGGVPFIENPGEPLLQVVLWQARLLLGAAFFLLAILVPGLIRSGQTSAVSWWLFAAPIGMLVAAVPGVIIESEKVTSLLSLALLLAVCVALGYAILVGSLSAALLAKRLLRLSPEGFVFVLAGSVAAASNAAVLVLETGTSLGWWALFAPAEVVILSAPYVLGAWTGPRGGPVTLLFLRTFGNASRSDRLLHAVCRSWLAAGEIHVIAGPDIAMSTASPEGVLRFATLLLGHHFIRSPADLERRLRTAKHRPALDGRYEVREYPCFENTWRPAMERLAAGADAILIDVRGYTVANIGTAFELATLGELRALERTLLIVDDSTPIQSVRTAIAAGGINGEVATFWVSDRKSRGEVARVLLSGIAPSSRT
jgi:hypothetical protein